MFIAFMPNDVQGAKAIDDALDYDDDLHQNPDDISIAHNFDELTIVDWKKKRTTLSICDRSRSNSRRKIIDDVAFVVRASAPPRALVAPSKVRPVGSSSMERSAKRASLCPPSIDWNPAMTIGVVYARDHNY